MRLEAKLGAVLFDRSRSENQVRLTLTGEVTVSKVRDVPFRVDFVPSYLLSRPTLRPTIRSSRRSGRRVGMVQPVSLPGTMA